MRGLLADPTINEAQMEMYADVESRGGILEPPGICEVKFRDKDQKAAMHRLDPVLLELDQDPEGNQDEISADEAQLLPICLRLLMSSRTCMTAVAACSRRVSSGM